jgi:hypothetical protein
MRVLDKEGYFYQIIFDRWDGTRIVIFVPGFLFLQLMNICNRSQGCRLSVCFREGGGMAIAALANAAALKISGDSLPCIY